MLLKLFWLGLAGAAGTLSRYGLAGLVQRLGGAGFPWGTVAVNVAGCFLAGTFWAFSVDRIALSGQVRTLVLVGYLGGFTTFSAFILETGHLAGQSQWLRACGNIAIQNVVGVLALFLGMATGRLL